MKGKIILDKKKLENTTAFIALIMYLFLSILGCLVSYMSYSMGELDFLFPSAFLFGVSLVIEIGLICYVVFGESK